MRKFVPREYQKLIVQFIVDNPRAAIWAGMGLGKTVSTLTALNILDLIDTGPTLVIAPLRVAVSTWPDEVKKWEHLSHMVVSPIVGDVRERRAALRVKADIYTINYDNIPWLVEEVGENWPFRRVVADESTKLKSFRIRKGSKRAKALATVAHCKVDRFINLTGTPSPNGLRDLWGQTWFLDKGFRLGRSFTAFDNRWFNNIRVGSQAFQVRTEPTACANEEIQHRLRDICLSLDAKDYFDISEPIVNNIYVTLPKKAKAVYDAMHEQMFVELASGNAVEAVNAASKTIKCLQIASGALYVEDGSFEAIHDEKLKALEDIVEEAAGAPVLVAYHFKSDLTRLLAHFPQGRTLDKNPNTIREWNEGRVPILFAHPASAGHGLNLQDGGNILVFFSHWWNLEEYQQIIERIGPTRQAQAGHNRPVFIHHLIAKDTLDDLVMERRISKKTVQDLLLEAMKRR